MRPRHLLMFLRHHLLVSNRLLRLPMERRKHLLVVMSTRQRQRDLQQPRTKMLMLRIGKHSRYTRLVFSYSQAMSSWFAGRVLAMMSTPLSLKNGKPLNSNNMPSTMLRKVMPLRQLLKERLSLVKPHPHPLHPPDVCASLTFLHGS
jgi:hypothetical protein